MEHWERDHLVTQLISGVIFCEIDGKVYTCRNPTSEQKHYSNKIYSDTYASAKRDGVWEDENLQTYLILSEQWSSAEESKLDKMIENVDMLKIKLYEDYDKPEREMVRRALNETRDAIDILFQKKHALDYLTCHGVSSSARMRFLTGCSIYYRNKPYWRDFSGWGKSDYLLDAIIEQTYKLRITDKQLRELSRTEPWRSTWAIAKKCGNGLFGKAAIDLTDSQKNIILYAQMYDNIAQVDEAPDETIIEDDDALDGWMLSQKKKRGAVNNKHEILSRIRSDKIRNADEVFVCAKSLDDIKKIYEVNDFAGKVALAQRNKQIKEEGCVNEVDLRETKMQIHMQRATQRRK